LGCVVINIGGPTTSLVVYEEGDVLHTAALPIGSAHITNDLALGLKTSIEVAERVKVEYGHCISRLFHKKDMVDIADLGAEKSELISKYFIAQIIEARICEIFERIDVELKKINRSALLPAGALFIGGGSKLNGLTDCAKEQLRLPAQLGYPLHIESISDKVNDIAFAPVIGMVKWGAHLSSETKRKPFAMHLKGQVAEKLKGIFKSLMP
jgi:cell division protein FtsA